MNSSENSFLNSTRVFQEFLTRILLGVLTRNRPDILPRSSSFVPGSSLSISSEVLPRFLAGILTEIFSEILDIQESNNPIRSHVS